MEYEESLREISAKAMVSKSVFKLIREKIDESCSTQIK